MSNKMMRKELLAAGLIKKPVQGGLNMQQQDGTKTEEQILTEVNARLGSVQERAEEIAKEEVVEQKEGALQKASDEKEIEEAKKEKERQDEESKRLALVSPGPNGLTPDLFSSKVDYSSLFRKNTKGLDEVKVSSHESINLVISSIIYQVMIFGNRRRKVFAENCKKFLMNLANGSALISINDKKVTFTSPDGTVTDTTVALAFWKDIPSAGRSADYTVDFSDSTVSALADKLELK